MVEKQVAEYSQALASKERCASITINLVFAILLNLVNTYILIFQNFALNMSLADTLGPDTQIRH